MGPRRKARRLSRSAAASAADLLAMLARRVAISRARSSSSKSAASIRSYSIAGLLTASSRRGRSFPVSAWDLGGLGPGDLGEAANQAVRDHREHLLFQLRPGRWAPAVRHPGPGALTAHDPALDG